MEIRKIDPSKELQVEEEKHLIDFLYENLGQFRDSREEIENCLKTARKKEGHIYLAQEENNTLGVVVILNTMMKSFIPPYFLVYIAVSKESQGKGIGTKLMEFIKNDLKEPICLHCEHDNPARKLYERVGFHSKYLEMRWYP